MTIKQLKAKLEGLNEDMEIWIPINQEFDGRFYIPCSHESGVTQASDETELSEEDIKEMELLNKDVPETNVFMFVPCGFFEEKNHSHELN